MSRAKRSIRTLVIAATILMLAAVFASPVSARGAEITRGSFAAFADGPDLGYDDVGGRAVMVRSGGKTIVVVGLRGLTPGATYGSHVHKQACDDGNAGGHYSFGHPVPGGALDGSEIWPGPFKARAGGRAFGWTVVGAVAGADAVSVVVHAPTGEKIACADLG